MNCFGFFKNFNRRYAAELLYELLKNFHWSKSNEGKKEFHQPARRDRNDSDIAKLDYKSNQFLFAPYPVLHNLGERGEAGQKNPGLDLLFVLKNLEYFPPEFVGENKEGYLWYRSTIVFELSNDPDSGLASHPDPEKQYSNPHLHLKGPGNH